MDQDQDLLDQLDRQEGPRVWTITALMAGMAVVAGAIGYFTLRLELQSSRELAMDGGALFAIAVGVALLVGYRRLK